MEVILKVKVRLLCLVNCECGYFFFLDFFKFNSKKDVSDKLGVLVDLVKVVKGESVSSF